MTAREFIVQDIVSDNVVRLQCMKLTKNSSIPGNKRIYRSKGKLWLLRNTYYTRVPPEKTISRGTLKSACDRRERDNPKTKIWNILPPLFFSARLYNEVYDHFIDARPRIKLLLPRVKQSRCTVLRGIPKNHSSRAASRPVPTGAPRISELLIHRIRRRRSSKTVHKMEMYSSFNLPPPEKSL